MKPVIQVSQVHYPESDGKPMGETDEHREEMVRHIELLTDYYQGQQVYVSGNLLVYYEQGNPRRFVVPDAFVVKGVRPEKRRIYKVWSERQPPCLIIETTSRKTRRKDTQEKPKLYAQLGVHEYIIFDPDQEYLEPPLQGYRLTGGQYVAIPADADGGLLSEELGLRLFVDDGRLQFAHPETGERLLTHAQRAEREAQRAESEAQRAACEAQRAESEAQRANRAEAARSELEAELAELRARLSRDARGSEESSS